MCLILGLDSLTSLDRFRNGSDPQEITPWWYTAGEERGRGDPGEGSGGVLREGVERGRGDPGEGSGGVLREGVERGYNCVHRCYRNT